MGVNISEADMNPVLKFALENPYEPYKKESGLDRIVAFGDFSFKCPTYVQRVPPCQNACPAGEDIRGYHSLIRGLDKSDNRWELAFYLIADKNPFPAIMGRVCPHPCQDGCNRKNLDETVSNNAVEHAIGEYAIKNNLKFARPDKSTGKKIAVIGGGPAGLSCAYQLRRRGHEVVLYDAQEKLGGMVRYGIMGYRVNRGILDKEIQRILDMGIELKMNTRVGKDVKLEDLSKQYDAVFVGVGAQLGRNLPIPGFDGSEYVSNAIKFLMDYESKGDSMTIGKEVVVIGDGDVAMDVARLSLRLGAKARVVSGVPREEMACKSFEFEEATQEGTQVDYQVGITEVVKNGDKVAKLKAIKMAKKDKGEDGWNSPIPFLRYKPVPGSDFEIQADMVVASIGQATDMSGLEATTNGKAPFLNVDHNHKVMGMDNVFGGGDAIKIDLITTAVGHGRKAAEAIDLYVSGQALPPKERYEVVEWEKIHPYYYEKQPQHKRSHKKISAVKGNFEEILQPLTEEEAIKESDRCFSCGKCFTCRQCLMFCPREAISLHKKNPMGEQIFTDYTKCIGCHICRDVCPCGYIEMGGGID